LHIILDQKYQKLDHLNDITEPSSDSTFVSRKSRSSVISSSLFDDWDNWGSDDHNLDNGDMQNKSSSSQNFMLTPTITPARKLMKRYFSKEISHDSSEDLDPYEISAAVANVLQPEYLEDMIRTAVNQKVERCIKSFFNNRADFTSSPSSYLSSAPQKRKYQVNLDFFFLIMIIILLYVKYSSLSYISFSYFRIKIM
jgi:hypothetical protein